MLDWQESTHRQNNWFKVTEKFYHLGESFNPKLFGVSELNNTVGFTEALKVAVSVPEWMSPLTPNPNPNPNPNPLPNPQPSHHTAALRSRSTRLLTGSGGPLHRLAF